MGQGEQPAFRRVAAYLRSSITGGELAPGERLPSEHTLANRFNTTRSTIRKSVALLKAEGLVITHQGRGAFVRSAPPLLLLNSGSTHLQRQASGKANFNAEVEAQGGRPEQRLLEISTVPAPEDVAERLAIPPGTMVLVRRRLMLVNDVPTQLADSYYRPELASDSTLALPKRVRGGVYAYLDQRYGLAVERFVEDLEIRMPRLEEADALDLPPGVPIARVLRTAISAAGDAFEVLASIVPGDRHRLRYEIELR